MVASGAAAQRAALAVDKQEITLKQLEEQITQELRTIYNNLIRSRAVIDSAVEARIETERNLEGEQAKYDAGIVVIRDLLEAQRQLSLTLSAEILAKINYRKTMLNYYKATAQTLALSNIELDSAIKGE